MVYILLLFLLLSEVLSQEVTTPSSLLGPRNFNPHPYSVGQDSKTPESSPTKQGPVLFPNDAPPAPKTPLIVTARPLIESIARSELNPNNTVTAQSQINGAFVPAYLTRVKAYRPIGRPGSDAATSFRDYDYQTNSDLPPIYQAFSDHTQQNTEQRTPKQYEYQTKQTDIPHQQYNDVHDDESSSEYNHGENYAFSYTVKDKERGDDFSHSQQSSGSATNGEYRVRLPDGRMQIVSYTADENGYKADVRYDDDTPVNNINNNYNNNHNEHVYNHNNAKHNYNLIDNTKYNTYSIKTSPVTYIDSNKITNDYNINSYSQNAYNDNINNNYAYNVNSDNAYNDNVNNGNSYNDNINDNNPRDKQFKVNNERDYYSDVSKEYANDDYSSEYNVKYEPHNSKFTTFLPKSETAAFQSSTVKPSYEELKHLFTKEVFNTQQNYDKDTITNIPYTTHNPKEIKTNIDDTNLYVTPIYSPEGYRAKVTPIYVPDFNQPAYTTHSPLDFTTERTVLIGGKRPVLFTDIKSSIPSLSGSSFDSTTPGSFLVATISSIKNNFKPSVLSSKFIDRVQKYLTFK